MEYENREQSTIVFEYESSLKGLILKTKEWWGNLISKWEKIVRCLFLGRVNNLQPILSKPQSRVELIIDDAKVSWELKQLQTIKVSGEVLNSNNIVYGPNKCFKYYINGTDRFDFNASKSGTYVKYANGSVASASHFLFFRSYPEVKLGSEILVPRRLERERISSGLDRNRYGESVVGGYYFNDY